MYNIVVNHLLLRKKKCFLDSLFEDERPVVKKNLIDPRLQCLQLSIFVVLLSLECTKLNTLGATTTKETRNLLRKGRISNKNNAWPAKRTVAWCW